ncbi:MAG: glycosyltransferase family 8 protein [Oscillospiraceae bacterium]|nr:glycosyltransferase family 8 protein [Oscillospiraceae bacterium]
MRPIALLTTLNEAYLPQLLVLLTSLHVNNPGETFCLYLIHRSFRPETLEQLDQDCAQLSVKLVALKVDETLFTGAPVSRQYPQEMYYRLLAPCLLPPELDRVIYLDPDILVINPIRPLWETDLQGNLFAAAAHTGKTELANDFNRFRLKTEHQYYNSGVLLIDLERGREEIRPEELFTYAREHPRELILPDQDILNILYGNRILALDDYIWNYDARNFSSYLLRSSGQADLDWVVSHTAILHFCGRAKPWKAHYRHRFGLLYKHYARLTDRFFSADPERKRNE